MFVKTSRREGLWLSTVVFVDADEAVTDCVSIANMMEGATGTIMNDGGSGLVMLYAEQLEDRIRVAKTPAVNRSRPAG